MIKKSELEPLKSLSSTPYSLLCVYHQYLEHDHHHRPNSKTVNFSPSFSVTAALAKTFARIGGKMAKCALGPKNAPERISQHKLNASNRQPMPRVMRT